MKRSIATWNVNSLKVRLPHLLGWLDEVKPDIVCLQELKCEDAAAPRADIEAAGYHLITHGQKTYNGVAILSREAPTDVQRNIPGYADAQSRVIAASIAGTRVVCAYFPNGQAVGSDKYAYKLEWLAALNLWLREELARHPRLILTGDFNIAPDERDTHPDWKDGILVSPAEREAFRALQDLGLTDAFRHFEQPERIYSWWDYRMNAYRRNFGLRIDHILVSQPLAGELASCSVDPAPRELERPSDHAPVIAHLR